jgi:hypothetical protein
MKAAKMIQIAWRKYIAGRKLSGPITPSFIFRESSIFQNTILDIEADPVRTVLLASGDNSRDISVIR